MCRELFFFPQISHRKWIAHLRKMSHSSSLIYSCRWQILKNFFFYIWHLAWASSHQTSVLITLWSAKHSISKSILWWIRFWWYFNEHFENGPFEMEKKCCLAFENNNLSFAVEPGKRPNPRPNTYASSYCWGSFIWKLTRLLWIYWIKNALSQWRVKCYDSVVDR